MNETPREQAGIWIGMIATIFPGLMVSGFMPDWNVLPFGGWLAIAGVGSAIAGAIATPRLVRGAIAGLLAGLGAMFGLWLYVMVRSALIPSNTFFNLELVIGGMLGAAPGLVLFAAWARQSGHDAT